MLAHSQHVTGTDVYDGGLADRLAARVGMPANKLKEFFASGEPKRAPHASELAVRPRGRMSVGRGNLLTQAITLVLHHPAAAGAIADPDLLSSIDKPGVSVLKELLEQAATASSPSTAMILERWRERPEHERLTELAMLDPLVADSGAAAKELKMAVEKLLQEYGPGRRMDELLKKAEELGLNYDEKAELSNLLKSKGRFRGPN